MFISLFNLTDKLLLVPLERIEETARVIGDPKINVGFVGMSARCGSTLVTQMTHRCDSFGRMLQVFFF